MIQVVVALGETLVRAAFAALLAQEEDIDVIAELPAAREVLRAAATYRPHVVVLHMDLLETEEPPLAGQICGLVHETRLLLLVDIHKPSIVRRVRTEHVPRVGYVAMDTSSARLVEAIRQIASGKAVLDPEVAVAALTAAENPLTAREREILAIVAQGVPVKEIAARLYLAVGTVRNNLSRILAKTGARTRIEAIKIAQDAGWL